MHSNGLRIYESLPPGIRTLQKYPFGIYHHGFLLHCLLPTLLSLMPFIFFLFFIHGFHRSLALYNQNTFSLKHPFISFPSFFSLVFQCSISFTQTSVCLFFLVLCDWVVICPSCTCGNCLLESHLVAHHINLID